MREPLLVKLIDYLKENKGRLIHGGDLERLTILNYWGEAETAKRRMRETQDPKHDNYCPNIKRQHLAHNCVAYQWTDQPEQLSFL